MTQQPHESWIRRTFDLARRGIGHVSPNPPVGAVLVYDDRLLGEGYHEFFGGPHAEVRAIRNVPKEETHLIPKSTLYVSLEPCCITGKTPPCTNLIIDSAIPRVVVSVQDPNPDISGKGIEQLEASGIDVVTGILPSEGGSLIRAFEKNILYRKPYVILKWAQSENLIIGSHAERIILSHAYTNAYSHTLRAAADAILVGARTVKTDDPSLTTRDAPGRSPHRVIYDPGGTLHDSYKVFTDDGCMVFYFSLEPNPHINRSHILTQQLPADGSHFSFILGMLFMQNIGILLVEGGAYVLNQFIGENQWDEAWVIRSSHSLNEGIKAPMVTGKLIAKIESASDVIVGIRNEPA